MTPRDQAERLFNRVMQADGTGDTAQARGFAPMAVAAYQALQPKLDDDRLHLGLLLLVMGEPLQARAQGDTILTARSTHLFGWALWVRSSEALGDTAKARVAAGMFLRHYDAERARRLPEYEGHAGLLDAIRADARSPEVVRPAPPRLASTPIGSDTMVTAGERRLVDSLAAVCRQTSPFYLSDRDGRLYDNIIDTRLIAPRIYASALLFNSFAVRRDGALTMSSGTMAALLDGYRTCIDHQIAQIERSPSFPGGTAESRYHTPQVSDGLIAWKTTLGLHRARSYLYHWDRERQDPNAARAGITAAMEAHERDLARALDNIQATYAERERMIAQENRNIGIGRALGTALAEGNRGASTLDALRTGYRAWESQQAVSRRQVAALRLESGQADLSARRVEWTEEGIRLHVFSFQFRSFQLNLTDLFGAGISSTLDHTRYLVRVAHPGGRCTGSFIGRNLILTNQHCVRSHPGAPVHPGLVVRQEWVEAEGRLQDEGPKVYQLSSKALTARVLTVSPEQGNWNLNRAHDWAVLQIQGEVLRSPGFLGLLSSSSSDLAGDGFPRIAIAGYSADIDDGRYVTMDWGCGVTGSGDGVLRHTCRTWKGSSGSPIVVSEGPSKGRVVGVHAFGYGETTLRGGGGPSADVIIAYLRANYPEGQ